MANDGVFALLLEPPFKTISIPLTVAPVGIDKLLNELKEKRSQRMSKIMQESASILNLVELWKEEESRNKMIKIAEIRKKNISSEIDRLSSMEEIKSRIMGISEEEVLNG